MHPVCIKKTVKVVGVGGVCGSVLGKMEVGELMCLHNLGQSCLFFSFPVVSETC